MSEPTMTTRRIKGRNAPDLRNLGRIVLRCAPLPAGLLRRVLVLPAFSVALRAVFTAIARAAVNSHILRPVALSMNVNVHSRSLLRSLDERSRVMTAKAGLIRAVLVSTLAITAHVAWSKATTFGISRSGLNGCCKTDQMMSTCFLVAKMGSKWLDSTRIE